MPKLTAFTFYLIFAASPLVLAQQQVPVLPELGDHTRAIEESQESLGRAYYNRGNAFRRLGDHPRAIADFNRALRFKPDYTKALNNRGLTYLAAGFSERAIADFDTVLQLDANNKLALNNRGIGHFLERRFAQAHTDLTSAKDTQPDPYHMLWFYLAGTRAGEDAIETLEMQASKLNSDEWPVPLVDAILGKTTIDTVRASNDSLEDTDSALKQKCETGFYLAAHLISTGDKADKREAEKLLREALGTGLKTRIEYVGARTELAALRRTPSDFNEIASKPYIATTTVNVREGPGTDHEKVGSIAKDAKVVVDATGEGWFFVRMSEGQSGFVASEFLRPLE